MSRKTIWELYLSMPHRGAACIQTKSGSTSYWPCYFQTKQLWNKSFNYSEILIIFHSVHDFPIHQFLSPSDTLSWCFIFFFLFLSALEKYWYWCSRNSLQYNKRQKVRGGSSSAFETGRWEVTGSIPGRASRPSRTEFSVVFSEIRVNTN